MNIHPPINALVSALVESSLTFVHIFHYIPFKCEVERVVFSTKKNFEPYFELDISIYFNMTIIWSPGNS